MTTIPSPTSTSSPRHSKFTEGQPLTRPDYLSQTPTSNQLFFAILNEMDEFERKKQAAQPHPLQINSQIHPQPHIHHRHRNSSASSNTSCPSPTGSHSSNSTDGNGNEITNETNREEGKLMETGLSRHFSTRIRTRRGSIEHVYGRKSLDIGIGFGGRRRRESNGGNEHEIFMQEGLEKVGKLGQKFRGRLRALTGGSSGGSGGGREV